MPITNFDSLPDSAQVWVYGSDRDLDTAAADKLLLETDSFLAQWQAHGVDLVSARDWSENRFLTIAVDREREGASGCSIDVLFRALKALEKEIDARLVTSGLVYFRDRDGNVRAVSRDEFTELSSKGEAGADSQVFDLSVTTLREWRGRFRSRAGDSWHASLLAEHV